MPTSAGREKKPVLVDAVSWIRLGRCSHQKKTYVTYKALTIKQTIQTSNNRVMCKLLAAMGGGGIISYRRKEGKDKKTALVKHAREFHFRPSACVRA